MCRQRVMFFALGLVGALAVGSCDDGLARDSADGNSPGAGAGAGADAATDAPDVGGDALEQTCGQGVPIEAACSAYCSGLLASCVGDLSPFVDVGECLTLCTAPSWACGSPGDTSGNTVFCRVGHADRAAMDPGKECPLAGPNSPACQ